MPYPTALRLQALKDLQDLGYVLEQDMDDTAYFTLNGEPIVFHEQEPHIQILINVYSDDAETIHDLPQLTK